MADIPRSVLSEHFQERMSGRRLRAAVFLTFQFDPGFFEQEVLPVFLDVPLSHAAPIRLVQLEDALRALPGGVAVYYDSNGLAEGAVGSAKLDVRRIPVRHPTGIFHAKNVFLLVEDLEPDHEGHSSRTLIVAVLSTNLTRSGWWENVEVCHVEEIAAGDKTRMNDDLAALLKDLQKKARAEPIHEAVRDVLDFLKSADQRSHKSAARQLHTHLYRGSQSVVEFLSLTAGEYLRGTYLEVISPYVDDADECGPLMELIDRFSPKEVRVYLPRTQAGEVSCRPTLFESVRQLPGVKWGCLPKEILKLGRSDDAGERFVHAKVYRFFTQNPKREICFVGSPNLTTAAHQLGGNWETGFLVDRTPPRRPEFWLSPLGYEPAAYQVKTESEGAATSRGTPLCLRYRWDESQAEVFWDATKPSPALRLAARGVAIGDVPSLAPRAWTALNSAISTGIAKLLMETSLFEVIDSESTCLILVQEEGMSHKPSLLFNLSAADILRYWSLLTADQRAAFLEARAPESALTGDGADLVARAKITLERDSLFDRFAGYFHAFGCLERSVVAALDGGNEKEATYRIFGKKYDSLGALLDRVESEPGTGDGVDGYVIAMCAKQLCHDLSRKFPTFWSNYARAARSLEACCNDLLSVLRQQLLLQNTPDFAKFLEWFDHWFLRRAAPAEEVES